MMPSIFATTAPILRSRNDVCRIGWTQLSIVSTRRASAAVLRTANLVLSLSSLVAFTVAGATEMMEAKKQTIRVWEDLSETEV